MSLVNFRQDVEPEKWFEKAQKDFRWWVFEVMRDNYTCNKSNPKIAMLYEQGCKSEVVRFLQGITNIGKSNCFTYDGVDIIMVELRDNIDLISLEFDNLIIFRAYQVNWNSVVMRENCCLYQIDCFEHIVHTFRKINTCKLIGNCSNIC